MQNDVKEKRKHPRIYVDLPLEYQLTDSTQRMGGLVINASESGLLVHSLSLKDLSVGTKLNIAVLFPRGFELTDFHVLAEIVWRDLDSTENREGYQFGVKFLNILKEDQLKLKEILGNGHKG